MKLFRFVLPLILFFSAQVIVAQKASGSGKVSDGKNQINQQTGFDDAESLATDFKNFKFSDKDNKEFQLTDGVYVFSNPKTKTSHNYQFRKVYYFDVTGDDKKEAVVHLLADSCEDCETRSIFYLFSAKDKKLQEVWKVFTGAGAKCGLKDVSFNRAEIVLETFGNCTFKDSSIIEDPLLKKSDVSTKFDFYFKDGAFNQESKENLPFKESEIINYRTKIQFGN